MAGYSSIALVLCSRLGWGGWRTWFPPLVAPLTFGRSWIKALHVKFSKKCLKFWQCLCSVIHSQKGGALLKFRTSRIQVVRSVAAQVTSGCEVTIENCHLSYLEWDYGFLFFFSVTDIIVSSPTYRKSFLKLRWRKNPGANTKHYHFPWSITTIGSKDGHVRRWGWYVKQSSL